MDREDTYYLIWIIMFGVFLALGGSFLEVVRLPFFSVTLATFWVAILITLNKIVLCRKFSVTHMYIVGSIIAIFTAYLGPPSPFKPILILAGFSFDLGTRFKTENYKILDFIIGHLLATISGFSLVWILFRIHTPDLAPKLIDIFLVASVAHFITSIVVTFVMFRLLSPNNPPENIAHIRDQVNKNSK